ncbi:nose resistant to fluoxetine protein 6-like [Centruroides sculpturatus]|nr:nose resistant to fluoxetine protein 6-like [Centruroides sculpturatus]
MKIILIILTIYAHVCLLLVYKPTIAVSYGKLMDIMDDILSIIFNRLFTMIETFFFISGFVLFYFRKENENGSKMKYVIFLMKRSIKFTILILCVVALAIVIPLFGDGPQWQLITLEGIYIEKNWWKFALHINNLIKTQTSYLDVTWCINALMQLTVLTVPLLFIQDRWPTVGCIIMSVLIVCGMISYMYDVLNKKYYEILGTFLNTRKVINYQPENYQKPYYSHLSSYCFGLLIGYIIQKNKHLKFGKTFLRFMWICSSTLIALILYGPYVFKTCTFPNENVIVAFQCVSPFIWTIGIAWLCVACVTGHGGVINKFLSHKIFIFLDHVSVWIYLLHIFIIAYVYGQSRRARTTTIFELIMVYFFVTNITLIASYIVFIFVQSPITRLISKLLQKKSQMNEAAAELETLPEVKQHSE